MRLTEKASTASADGWQKKLLINGTPLTTIAQILGHDDPKSARQYLSLDTGNLKECALDFKGIPRLF